MKVAIMGAGAFGFAMAMVISENCDNLHLYDPVSEIMEELAKNRRHPYFHKDITLPEKIHLAATPEQAVKDADVIVLAIPGAFMRNAVKDMRQYVKDNVIFLNLAKSLEPETNKRMDQVVKEEMQGKSFKIAVLAGGMIADEVSKKFPLCADIACEDIGTAKLLQKIFQTNSLNTFVTDDIFGVEIAGALKNVVAIGAGFFDGLGYAESSKAAFVSEAAREIQEFAIALGAKKETFDLGSHAWLGDLLTTCFGASRNRYFGELIGSGLSPDDALQKLIDEKKRSEGYLTTKAFYLIGKEKNLHMPILEAVYHVLFEGKPVDRFIEEFMKR